MTIFSRHCYRLSRTHSRTSGSAKCERPYDYSRTLTIPAPAKGSCIQDMLLKFEESLQSLTCNAPRLCFNFDLFNSRKLKQASYQAILPLGTNCRGYRERCSAVSRRTRLFGAVGVPDVQRTHTTAKERQARLQSPAVYVIALTIDRRGISIGGSRSLSFFGFEVLCTDSLLIEFGSACLIGNLSPLSARLTACR